MLAEYNISINRELTRTRVSTSVYVNTSLPTPGGLNLTLLTPQPGALPVPLVQSHGWSNRYPDASPVAIRSRPRLLFVCSTFSGFVLRTSHTTTAPSCDPTANLDPSVENAVENDAGTELMDSVAGV